jgi:predicted site-specific integrase-resolvase
MPADLLTPFEAAQRLGITVTTLYDWLGQSDRGLLMVRGQTVTIDYFQGGAKGQGRIRIEEAEVERIKELMRVRPRCSPSRRPPVRPGTFPGISVPLGLPPR